MAKKLLLGVFIVCIVWGVISLFQTPQQKALVADEYEGRFLLDNLASAEIIYSTQKGGNGQKKFTANIEQLSIFSSDKAIKAITTKNHSPVPYKGYIVSISEKETGDNFENDFLLTAMPANGYTGKIMHISKDKKIIISGEAK
mgnify:CR=1 FL=1